MSEHPWDAYDEEIPDEPWRGGVHWEQNFSVEPEPDWPVDWAGPEYWLWLAELKRQQGEGD